MQNRYRNKFEQNTGDKLDELGIDFGYETERLPYVVEGKYIPDFIITTRSGSKVYIETKGNGRSFDGPAKRKMLAVKKQNPSIDLRVVFYSDGKCGPKRKDGTFMRQSDWAIKHGFQYAIRDIPESWLSE